MDSLLRRIPRRRVVQRLGRQASTVLLVTATLVAGAPAPAAETESWRWPLRGQPRIVRNFDPPAVPWEPAHRGVDLAARTGDPVFAAGRGRVVYAGILAGRGVISITHGAIRTTYEPVAASVRVGQSVGAGQRIGTVAATPGHCRPGTCLHWGLLRDDVYLNPLGLLGRGPIRLLPVWSVPRPMVCADQACLDAGRIDPSRSDLGHAAPRV